MVWLNWICALFFFMFLALPGCRGATWTEEDERLARERNLGRIVSRARNNGPSSGSVQSPLSQVLRGSSSRVKFGGFSSDGFPSSQTSSSESQTSDRFPSTRTSSPSSATRTSDPLSQVLRGSSSRVKFGGFSSDGFPSSQTSSSASLTSDDSRTTARRPSQGSISSSVSSQNQGSSAASSQRQGSSSGSSPRGSSQRQGPSSSYIPNFIGQSRGGFVIPQNIHTVDQNSFQTSSPRNSGPFQRPISGSSQASTDRISGSFQVRQIMDKSSQTSSFSGCLSCHLVIQGS